MGPFKKWLLPRSQHVGCFIFVSAAFALGGCSLQPQGTSSIQVSLPQGVSKGVRSQDSSNRSLIKPKAGNLALTSLVPYQFPTSYSDFDCYALTISGDGISSTVLEYDSDVQTSCASVPSSFKQSTDIAPGQFTDFVNASSGSISAQIKMGKSRKISLIGAKLTPGVSSCPTWSQLKSTGLDFGRYFTSRPLLVSQTTADITESTTEVVLPASFFNPARPLLMTACGQPGPMPNMALNSIDGTWIFRESTQQGGFQNFLIGNATSITVGGYVHPQADTISFYSGSGCVSSTLIGSGTRAAFVSNSLGVSTAAAPTGISSGVGVSINLSGLGMSHGSVVSIYSQWSNARGETSICSPVIGYEYDVVPIPNSPIVRFSDNTVAQTGNSGNPIQLMISNGGVFSSYSNFAGIQIFNDSTCQFMPSFPMDVTNSQYAFSLSEILAGTTHSFYVNPRGTTFFYATAVDKAGNHGPCSPTSYSSYYTDYRTGSTVVMNTMGLNYPSVSGNATTNWAPISSFFPTKDSSWAVWTGKKAVFWGNCTSGTNATDGTCVSSQDVGYTFDPTTNAWSSMSTPPSSLCNYGSRAIWVPSIKRVAIFGGSNNSNPVTASAYCSQITFYDPDSNSWSQTSPTGFSGRRDFGMAWDSYRNNMVIYGGREFNGTSGERYVQDISPGYLLLNCTISQSNLSVTCQSSNSGMSVPAATRRYLGTPSDLEVFVHKDGYGVFGTYQGSGTQWFGFRKNGSVFEAISMPSAGSAIYTPRQGHSEVWNNVSELFVWGGLPASGGSYFGNGSYWNWDTNSWTDMQTAPIGSRGYHAAVWAGDRMIITGGNMPGSVNSYDYATYQLSNYSGYAWKSTTLGYTARMQAFLLWMPVLNYTNPNGNVVLWYGGLNGNPGASTTIYYDGYFVQMP